MDIELKVDLGMYAIITANNAMARVANLINNVWEYAMTSFNLTQSRLKEVLNYNPVTGIFTWIKKTSKYSAIIIGSEAGITHKTQQGKRYRIICIDGFRYKAHRLVWLYVHGIFPERIDHEDGNGIENKYKNIRNVSTLENGRNRRLPSNNKSGVIGVGFNKQANKWVSSIRIKGKSVFLGYFEDIKDAAVARKIAEKKYSFHENHGEVREL